MIGVRLGLVITISVPTSSTTSTPAASTPTTSSPTTAVRLLRMVRVLAMRGCIVILVPTTFPASPVPSTTTSFLLLVLTMRLVVSMRFVVVTPTSTSIAMPMSSSTSMIATSASSTTVITSVVSTSRILLDDNTPIRSALELVRRSALTHWLGSRTVVRLADSRLQGRDNWLGFRRRSLQNLLGFVLIVNCLDSRFEGGHLGLAAFSGIFFRFGTSGLLFFVSLLLLLLLFGATLGHPIAGGLRNIDIVVAVEDRRLFRCGSPVGLLVMGMLALLLLLTGLVALLLQGPTRLRRTRIRSASFLLLLSFRPGIGTRSRCWRLLLYDRSLHVGLRERIQWNFFVRRRVGIVTPPVSWIHCCSTAYLESQNSHSRGREPERATWDGSEPALKQ